MNRNGYLAPLGNLLIAGGLLIACSPTASPGTAPVAQPSSNGNVASATREIYVYKSSTCSCCHEWESYLTSNGYTVRSMPRTDMSEIKEQMGVPNAAWSCHTAVIDGYVVEGHVPIAAINDLLARRAAIDGIALPGMPAGSPGMPGVQGEPFEVLALSDGETSSFGAY